MAATIYKFPSPPAQEPKYRIPLYSDEEVEVAVISVNVFCNDNFKYNIDTLNFTEPVLVIECLKSSITSKIFSERFKIVARQILKNVEVIG